MKYAQLPQKLTSGEKTWQNGPFSLRASGFIGKSRKNNGFWMSLDPCYTRFDCQKVWGKSCEVSKGWAMFFWLSTTSWYFTRSDHPAMWIFKIQKAGLQIPVGG
jgi:hypothetical protein